MSDNKEKIWIEEKEYPDRSEFRIKVRKKYPAGLERKGEYEEYLNNWVTFTRGSHSIGGTENIVFTAWKGSNWLKSLFGDDFNAQKVKALTECHKVIRAYKLKNKEPIVKHHVVDW